MGPLWRDDLYGLDAHAASLYRLGGIQNCPMDFFPLGSIRALSAQIVTSPYIDPELS